jgi:arginine deiminase
MLPRFSTTIHLDMVFSQIDVDSCIIYPPVILKPWNKNIIRVKVNPDGKKTFYEYDGLLPALKKVGLDLNPIYCGGEDPVFQQREQWSSGCNFFAFAPGKVIGYSMNQKTLEEFCKAGFNILEAGHVIKNPSSLKSNGKIVITINGSELARGSGGCRCMTLPLERAEVKL